MNNTTRETQFYDRIQNMRKDNHNKHDHKNIHLC